MTDEQIRQNAADYVYNFQPTGVITEDRLKCYIAGAHSRDEEIEQLKKLLFEKDCDIQFLEHKLRNPWISVEENLPPEFKSVIVMFDSGIIINAFMTMVKDEPAWHPSVQIPIGSDVIFWMPTMQIKEGE